MISVKYFPDNEDAGDVAPRIYFDRNSNLSVMSFCLTMKGKMKFFRFFPPMWCSLLYKFGTVPYNILTTYRTVKGFTSPLTSAKNWSKTPKNPAHLSAFIPTRIHRGGTLSYLYK